MIGIFAKEPYKRDDILQKRPVILIVYHKTDQQIEYLILPLEFLILPLNEWAP